MSAKSKKFDEIPDTMPYTDEDRKLAPLVQREALPWYLRTRNQVGAAATTLAVVIGGGALVFDGDDAKGLNKSPSSSADKDSGPQVLDPNLLTDIKPPADELELRETLGRVFDEDAFRQLAYDENAVSITDELLNSTVSNSGDESDTTGQQYTEFMKPIGNKFLDKKFLDAIYTDQVKVQKNVFGNVKVWNNPEEAKNIIGEVPYITQTDINDALASGNQIPLVEKLIGKQIDSQREAELLYSQLSKGDVNTKLENTIKQYAHLGSLPQQNQAYADKLLLETTADEYKKYMQTHKTDEGFEATWYQNDDKELIDAKILRVDGYALTDNYETGPQGTVAIIWTQETNDAGDSFEYVHKVVLTPAPVKASESELAVQAVVIDQLQVYR